jgi:nicotinate-nucleotide adenylyltransferase
MGHLHIAETARVFCGLHEVLFLPAAVPPHKDSKVVAGFNDRANMIQLALADNPAFRLSTIEASLPLPSYTVDTLRYFQTHAAIATEFFFIIGADAFLDIASWKLFRQVLGAAHFVVVDRAGCASSEVHDLIARLGYEPEEPSQTQTWYHPASLKKIFSPAFSSVDISSSRIRQNVKNNRAIDGLVPPAVLEYIQTHGLYV